MGNSRFECYVDAAKSLRTAVLLDILQKIQQLTPNEPQVRSPPGSPIKDDPTLQRQRESKPRQHNTKTPSPIRPPENRLSQTATHPDEARDTPTSIRTLATQGELEPTGQNELPTTATTPPEEVEANSAATYGNRSHNDSYPPENYEQWSHSRDGAFENFNRQQNYRGGRTHINH